MHKKILFPFSSDRELTVGYNWAMELASRMNAALFFFTTVPDSEQNKAAFVDHLSHSLLEAQGNYLQHASMEISPAKTERHIGEGDFTFSLSKFVRKNRFDIVVIDPVSSHLTAHTLDYVVENSNGVIVLPEHNNASIPQLPLRDHQGNPDDFYDVLHKADLYKLPENFFTTLGKDRRLFNYLRTFFRKKSNARQAHDER